MRGTHPTMGPATTPTLKLNQPDEVAAIDALDTGVRGGPELELLNRETAPLVVDNS